MALTFSLFLRIVAAVCFFVAILAPVFHPPIEVVALGLLAWVVSTMVP